MNEQLTLAPVHRNDPVESVQAANKVDAKLQLHMVLIALYHAEGPLTDDELGERCGLLRHSAGTRRGVAAGLGYVTKVGRGLTPRGNPCGRWTLTPAGVEYVQRMQASA